MGWCGRWGFCAQQIFANQCNVATQRIQLVCVRQWHRDFLSKTFKVPEFLQERMAVLAVKSTTPRGKRVAC